MKNKRGNRKGMTKNLIILSSILLLVGLAVLVIAQSQQDELSQLEQEYEADIILVANSLNKEDIETLGASKELRERASYDVHELFEKKLDKTKDITIYARAECNESIAINGIDVPCDIYYKKLRLDALRRENG